MLTQNFDGITKPIGYYSHCLKDNEMRYSTFNAEMTAVVAALELWETLLKGEWLVIFIDHLPLMHHSKRDAKTMSNLIQKIFIFTFYIVHLKALA